MRIPSGDTQDGLAYRVILRLSSISTMYSCPFRFEGSLRRSRRSLRNFLAPSRLLLQWLERERGARDVRQALA